MNRIAVPLLVAIGILVCGEAVAAPALNNLKPIIACNLLQEIGLGGRGWRNDYDDVYGCSSPYKELGSGHPLANNLAYYVEGKPRSVLQVKLVLNVNVRAQAESAQRELLKAAELLAKKVLGAELPPSVKSALTVGKNSSAKVGGTSVQVIRIDWPTGKGYEVKFIVE
jgi:hypothetical protein